MTFVIVSVLEVYDNFSSKRGNWNVFLFEVFLFQVSSRGVVTVGIRVEGVVSDIPLTGPPTYDVGD